MTSPAPSPCPHCRTTMPPGFLFCRPCFKELGFDLRVRLWTDQSRAHFPDLFPQGPDWFASSLAAAKSHLAQFSSAL